MLRLSTVASWFLSPVLSGIMSAILFYFVRKFILNKVKLIHWEYLIRSIKITSTRTSCSLESFS